MKPAAAGMHAGLFREPSHFERRQPSCCPCHGLPYTHTYTHNAVAHRGEAGRWRRGSNPYSHNNLLISQQVLTATHSITYTLTYLHRSLYTLLAHEH